MLPEISFISHEFHSTAMETENILSGYFKRLQKSINKKLEKSPKNYDTEEYHQLRVEIKKLKALIDFIAYCFADFKRKKVFKPLRRLFRKAGRMREFQLKKGYRKV